MQGESSRHGDCFRRKQKWKERKTKCAVFSPGNSHKSELFSAAQTSPALLAAPANPFSAARPQPRTQSVHVRVPGAPSSTYQGGARRRGLGGHQVVKQVDERQSEAQAHH